MWFEVDLGQHRLRCDGQNYAMLISRRELPVVDPDFCLSVGVGGAYMRTLFFRLCDPFRLPVACHAGAWVMIARHRFRLETARTPKTPRVQHWSNT